MHIHIKAENREGQRERDHEVNTAIHADLSIYLHSKISGHITVKQHI